MFSDKCMKYVCHRPDGLEEPFRAKAQPVPVCHRPDGLEVCFAAIMSICNVCHRPDGLED